MERVMQLSDLVTPIEEQTDEELRERLQALRSRREMERPAKAKHKEKVQKKETRKKTAPIRKLLEELSPEQIELLLRDMEQ
jgi:hypothetical protein